MVAQGTGRWLLNSRTRLSKTSESALANVFVGILDGITAVRAFLPPMKSSTSTLKNCLENTVSILLQWKVVLVVSMFR